MNCWTGKNLRCIQIIYSLFWNENHEFLSELRHRRVHAQINLLLKLSFPLRSRHTVKRSNSSRVTRTVCKPSARQPLASAPFWGSWYGWVPAEDREMYVNKKMFGPTAGIQVLIAHSMLSRLYKCSPLPSQASIIQCFFYCKLWSES